LVMNAIKFRNKAIANPQIEVTIRCKQIKGPANERNGWVSRVTTEVSDNGIGIEKERQGGLLYTFKAKQKDSRQGVGIGLSTVRAVSEALGGSVKLISTPGVGTSVYFTIPVAKKNKKLRKKQILHELTHSEVAVEKPEEKSQL